MWAQGVLNSESSEGQKKGEEDSASDSTTGGTPPDPDDDNDNKKKVQGGKDSSKNEPHANQKRKAVNKAKYETEKKKLADMKSKPNKTKVDKKAIEKQKRLVKKLREGAERKGPHDSQRGAGGTK